MKSFYEYVKVRDINEDYYDSRKPVEGYVDAKDLVGQRLWFHTNRSHKIQGLNGMIGIYKTTPSGRKKGSPVKYTNEVRLSEPIFFQTSESGAKQIVEKDKRTLIAGVSGKVVPTNNDTSGMVKITYNPFNEDAPWFHAIADSENKEIVSASEVYFNATENGQWDIWAKNPVHASKTL